MEIKVLAFVYFDECAVANAAHGVPMMIGNKWMGGIFFPCLKIVYKSECTTRDT